MWIGYKGYCKFLKSEFKNFNYDFVSAIRYYKYTDLKGFIKTNNITEYFVIDDNLIGVVVNATEYVFYQVTSGITSSGTSIRIDNFNKDTFIDFISQLNVISNVNSK